MRSGACLLLLTIVWPLARAFDVSWFSVPQEDDNDFYGSENEIPQPRIRPDRPSKPAYHIWTEDLFEENRICAKYDCTKDPCCEGQCIDIFGTKLCIQMGRRKK